MSKKKVHEALKKQMMLEIQSSYIYQGMRAWFTNNNWDGFSHFMKVQADEELEHAEKIYKYLSEVGYDISLDALTAPSAKYENVGAVFQAALDHEKFVTESIHKLYELASDEKDYAAAIFLEWFVSEQVEEEANFTEIVGTLKLIGENAQGLIFFDKQLGAR